MALYSRPDTEDQDLKDIEAAEAANEEATQETKEDTTDWKKRYGDLRSYSAKKENELISTIDGLKTSMATPQAPTEVPKSKKDMEDMKAKYPAMFDAFKTLILEETGVTNKQLKADLETIKISSIETAKDSAKERLAKEHPDFFGDSGIASTNEFGDWLRTQAQAVQDAVLINETDWQSAANTVQAYKDYVELTGFRAAKADPKANAQQVKTKGGGNPTTSNTKGRIYKESEIEKMNPVEYELLEEDIDIARTEGRLVYDK